MASKRNYDINGWAEIKDNPISKVGIFDYLGSSISDTLDPNKIYKVYRPEDELSDEACLDSFKLLPWIDDHEMLGPDHTPAEKKGIHGTIGENVYFDSGIIYANLKVFSDSMSSLIDGGKKQLSAGYRCEYDLTPGVWNGQHYDAVQRKIRGNHLALVDQGRMGPGVAVQDKLTITFDTKELKMTVEDKKVAEDSKTQEVSLGDLAAQVKALTAAMDGITSALAAQKVAQDAVEAEAKKKKDEAEDSDPDEDETEAADKKAMDQKIATITQDMQDLKKNAIKIVTKEISDREALVAKLSPHIGAFDHSEMTLDEVAAYGVEKLKLAAPKGYERVALDGYLQGRPSPLEDVGFSFDAKSKSASSKIDAYYAQ